jgi:hypothetical protein
VEAKRGQCAALGALKLITVEPRIVEAVNASLPGSNCDIWQTRNDGPPLFAFAARRQATNHFRSDFAIAESGQSFRVANIFALTETVPV